MTFMGDPNFLQDHDNPIVFFKCAQPYLNRGYSTPTDMHLFPDRVDIVMVN